jgi:hypothetical protein
MTLHLKKTLQQAMHVNNGIMHRRRVYANIDRLSPKHISLDTNHHLRFVAAAAPGSVGTHYLFTSHIQCFVLPKCLHTLEIANPRYASRIRPHLKCPLNNTTTKNLFCVGCKPILGVSYSSRYT